MAIPYNLRYGGGFADLPSQTTPIDKTFLDAVEAALIQLCATAPAANKVPIWNAGNSRFEPGQIADAQVAAAAAIAYSKLNLATSVTTGDFAAGKIFDPTKIMQNGAASGQSLIWNGTNWAPAAAGAMTLIDGYTVAGSAIASYDTNTRLGGNIPQTYKHLRLIASIRGDVASVNTAANLTVNSDTTPASYASQMDYSLNATITEGSATGYPTNLDQGTLPGATAAGGYFGSLIVDIFDYTSTIKTKSFMATSFTYAGGPYMVRKGVSYNLNGAVIRFAIAPTTNNYIIGSSFALYGIAG